MDTLCVLPFIHFNLLPNGQASLCCVSTAPLLDSDGKPLNVRTHALTEIWNSDALGEVRALMLAGERPSQCAGCYIYEEAAGAGSHRTGQNSLFLVDRAADIAPTNDWVRFPKIGRDQLKPDMGKPWYFDLRFDNLCNLKCIICFAYASSRIERDPVHRAWTGEPPIERNPNRFGTERWVRSEILFDELRDIGSEVRYIQLAGGEPFMSELAMKWLKHLGETGRANFVTLKVFTNLNTFNDEIVSLLEPFRFIDMTLSIDGVGRVYEYVRYPGRWSTVAANAERLAAEQQGRLKHMNVSINATMSAHSAMGILDVFKFARSHGFGCALGNAMEPAYVSTKYLPTRAKDHLERQLRAYAREHGDYFVHMDREINQWMTELRSVDISEAAHRDAVLNLMRFTNDMDASRGLSFRSIMPQLHADYCAEFEEWISERRHSVPHAPAPTDYGTTSSTV